MSSIVTGLALLTAVALLGCVLELMVIISNRE